MGLSTILVKGEPLYKPQDEEWSLPALSAYLAALQKSNSQVWHARNAYTFVLRSVREDTSLVVLS